MRFGYRRRDRSTSLGIFRSMNDDPTLTIWLQRLQLGDSDATWQLWEAFYPRMVALAQRKLENKPRLIASEEDVALSAFKSFCRGVENKRFADLKDRAELWKLLVTITLNKVLHAVRDANRQKRGGGWQQQHTSGDNDVPLAELLISAELSPELTAQLAEEYERLLGQLTPDLVELAVMKMDGYTNEEIAERWGKAERTVERKLQLIRQIWSKEIGRTSS